MNIPIHFKDWFQGLHLSGSQVDYLLSLFNKFGNEIVGEDEDISSNNGVDLISGRGIQYYNAVRNQLRHYQRKLIKKILEK